MEDAVETAAVKREDQRTREWPRARGRQDLLPLDGEREKEDRGERICGRKREGGKERRQRKVERERRKESARRRNIEKKRIERERERSEGKREKKRLRERDREKVREREAARRKEGEGTAHEVAEKRDQNRTVRGGNAHFLIS